MFLSNWLVFKTVAASIIEGISYPVFGDLSLNFDSENLLYLSGGSRNFISDISIYKDDNIYEITNIIQKFFITNTGKYKLTANICNVRHMTNEVNITNVNLSDSQPTLEFDGLNRLFFSNIEDDSNAVLIFNSNTYDIGNASNIYISNPGTYEVAIKSNNVFAFASNTVSSVSFNGSPPTLDFDGLNRLFLSNIEDDSNTSLTFNSNTYDIGTASNIYISNLGTYEVAIKSNNVFAFASNTVSSVSFNGSPPTLDFNGLNTITASNITNDAHVSFFYNDKVISCEDNSITQDINLSGNYYATEKNPNIFAITNSIVADTDKLFKYPPIGVIDNLTVSTNSGVNSIWNLGNDEYRVNSSVSADSSSGPFGLFTDDYSGSTIIDGVTLNNYFAANTTGFDIILTMPAAKTIKKYLIHPVNGGDDAKKPSSWSIQGSNDLSSWTTLHSVSNSPLTTTPTVYTLSSSGSYIYYKLANIDNNGNPGGLEIGEWELWGDKDNRTTIIDFSLSDSVNVNVEGFYLDQGWKAIFTDSQSNTYIRYGYGILGEFTLDSQTYNVTLIDDSGYRLTQTYFPTPYIHLSGTGSDILPPGVSTSYASNTTTYKVGSSSIDVSEITSSASDFKITPFSKITSNTITVLMWVYRTNQSANFMGLVSHDAYSSGNSWAFEIDSSQSIVLWLYQGNAGWHHVANSNFVVPLNQWCFVGFTIDNQNIALFHSNGSTLSNSTVTLSITPQFASGYGLEIGQIDSSYTSSTTNEFDSYIDSFRFYDSVLTNTEIQNILISES